MPSLIISILTGLSNIILLEIGFAIPRLFWLCAGLSYAIVMYIYWICWKKKRGVSFIHGCILHTLTTVFVWLFFIFIDNSILQHLWIIAAGGSVALVTAALTFRFRISPAIPSARKIRLAFRSLLVLFLLYMIAVVSFASIVVVGLSPLIAGISVLACTVYLSWMWFEGYHILIRHRIGAALIATLIGMESFVMIMLWPTTIYAMGCVWLIVMYMALGVVRQYSIFGREGFTQRVLFRYLFLFIIGLLGILMSARWR